VNVGEIMNTSPCTVEPEATVAEAATLMGERHVGSLLVVEDDRLVGIFTERDIVRALSSTHDAPTTAVVEWMTKLPQTAAPETDVRAALQTMVDGGFRHLPVCLDDRIAGVISMRDVAAALAES
jgi:CBS domain-containing protein